LVIETLVYFAVPDKVEALDLKPGSDSIFVEWTPSSNSDCVTEYIIDWGKTPSGSDGTQTVSKDEFSYTIPGLDSCVEYAVSVTAVNADNDAQKDPLTGTATTGNYHAHIILLCL
jgi:hypothetical protein